MKNLSRKVQLAADVFGDKVPCNTHGLIQSHDAVNTVIDAVSPIDWHQAITNF